MPVNKINKKVKHNSKNIVKYRRANHIMNSKNTHNK